MRALGAALAAVMMGFGLTAHAAAAAAHTESVEAVELASLNAPPMLIHSATFVPHATLLPDLQTAHVRPLVLPRLTFVTAPSHDDAALPDSPSAAAEHAATPGDLVPTRLKRMGGDRFNTSDGSFSSFAVCYRLASRYALQVVPGDPAPVKLPVSTIQNNTGVTVGMVVRIGK